MSASNQKNPNAKAQATKRSIAEAEEAKKNQQFRRNAIIAVVLIIVLVAAAAVINSDLFYTKTTAIEINGTAYSPVELNYFFKSSFSQTYQSIYDSFGSYASYILDTSTPLSEQSYSEDQTWAEVIYEYALEDMTQVTAFYDAAVREGMTLDEDALAEVESTVSEMTAYAQEQGFKNLSKFLAAYYGKGMTEKLFTDLTKRVALANQYSDAIVDSLVYTDEELTAYYEEHALELNYYAYYARTITTSDSAFDDLEEDAKDAAAKETAERFAAAADLDEFLTLTTEFSESSITPTISRVAGSSLNDAYVDWLTAPERKEGDTTVIANDTGYAAIYFVEVDTNDYNTVDMRHILVSAEADENGDITEEALAASRESAEAMLNEYLLTSDEGIFATMANTYSDDTGSNTNGGLYTEIAKNEMVPEINDWLFGESHEPGDTAVVTVESSNYSGSHVLYFVGENGLKSLSLAKNAMMSDAYNAKVAELTEGYTAVEGSGLKFATLDT